MNRDQNEHGQILVATGNLDLTSDTIPGNIHISSSMTGIIADWVLYISFFVANKDLSTLNNQCSPEDINATKEHITASMRLIHDNVKIFPTFFQTRVKQSPPFVKLQLWASPQKETTINMQSFTTRNTLFTLAASPHASSNAVMQFYIVDSHWKSGTTISYNL